jgi:hypothetical protein
MKLKYFILDQGETLDDARVFDLASFDKSWEELAVEQLADHYHFCHDGWEASWPITFEVYREDDSKIGSFIVERKAVPEFSARRVDG